MALILTMMLGLAAGYVTVVLLYLAFTIAVTAAVPHFVSFRGRFRPTYLLTSYAAWLLCAAIGGYLATWLSAAWFPWLPVAVLAFALAAVSWLHPIEAKKQLAGLSRFVMPAASFLGVALGYFLRIRH